MYCVEHVQHQKPHLNGDKVLLCVLPPTQKFLYTRVAMVISCVFIALTIIVYLWLHEKRNLFSKTLITYCVSLFLMYTNLAYVQFNKNIPTTACTGIGKCVYILCNKNFTRKSVTKFQKVTGAFRLFCNKNSVLLGNNVASKNKLLLCIEQ